MFYSDGTTTEAPSTNEGHHQGEMTLYSDVGMMIIAGKRTRTTELFTEASNEWVMLSDVPAPFYKFSSVTFKGTPYIFGGEQTKSAVATFTDNNWVMSCKSLIIDSAQFTVLPST